jgi:hypothetical protein
MARRGTKPKSPYWLRVRGVATRRKREDWDKGHEFRVENFAKGSEVLLASFRGAVVLRVRGENDESVRLKVSLIPWKDELGNRRGVTRVLYDGSISGYDLTQASMFGKEPTDE